MRLRRPYTLCGLDCLWTAQELAAGSARAQAARRDETDVGMQDVEGRAISPLDVAPVELRATGLPQQLHES